MPDLAASRPSALRLVALCFTMLFIELALIRWIGANVVYVSYFSNLVLLGSFLGIGIGFLRAGRARRSLAPLAPIALGLLVMFLSAVPVEVPPEQNGLIFFGGKRDDADFTGLPIWVTLPVVFVAVAFVLATIGEAVARTFARFRPLQAYRLDILGSLLGIVAIAGISYLGAPPIVWGAIAAVLLVWLFVVGEYDGTRRGAGLLALVQVASILLVVVSLAGQSLAEDTRWSPYYEVTWFDDQLGNEHIYVNGIPHQAIQTVEQARNSAVPFYLTPYETRAEGDLDDVLVIGAGNGTDVAVALASGAKRVDAVEIDPELQRLGREKHPDRPYQDDRVTAHINDGRAFLEQTDRKYDQIFFALSDSLTLVSGQSSLRLESFLFTREAIDLARSRLKEGGSFSMYNSYRTTWLVDRLAGTLADSFGHAPCVFREDQGGHFAVMTVALERGADRCPENYRWERPETTPAPATDDHPFVYLKEPSIPALYLATLGMILLVSVVSIHRASGGIRHVARYGDLFLMGIAFLLLETKNVVQFALLFGTTWLVNALVFAAILVAVLAAIEVADRWTPKRPWVLYAALVATLAASFVVPGSWLLELDFWPRFLAAGALAFAPIFVANLIFADRFRDTASSTTAFGVNLLGAMVGGVLEYGALVVGYRALLVAVALLYLAAFVARRRIDRRPQPLAIDVDPTEPSPTVRDAEPVGT